MEPSPTAEATRFTEPWRTSPATKTPGTLLSSRNGSRFSCQTSGILPSLRKIRPGKQKSLVVAQNARRKPGRDRRRADKNKQRGCRHLRFPPPGRATATPPDARRPWPPAPACAPPPQYWMFERSHRSNISTWWPKAPRRAPAWLPWWHIWRSGGQPGRRSWRRRPCKPLRPCRHSASTSAAP